MYAHISKLFSLGFKAEENHRGGLLAEVGRSAWRLPAAEWQQNGKREHKAKRIQNPSFLLSFFPLSPFSSTPTPHPQRGTVQLRAFWVIKRRPIKAEDAKILIS